MVYLYFDDSYDESLSFDEGITFVTLPSKVKPFNINVVALNKNLYTLVSIAIK